MPAIWKSTDQIALLPVQYFPTMGLGIALNDPTQSLSLEVSLSFYGLLEVYRVFLVCDHGTFSKHF